MPFQSEKQRRYLWANEPEIARDWTDRYGARGGGIMDTASNGNLIHDFKNYKKGNSVNVPTSFQARSHSTPVNLAYITDKEKGILQALKPGTPHEGPMGIPNYNDYDPVGGYRTGAAMSAAESGAKNERARADYRASGMSPQEVQDIRSGAIASGACQTVNPGWFGPRHRPGISKQDLRAAKQFAPKAYRATRGSPFGIGNLFRGAMSMFGGIPGKVGSMLSHIDPRQLRGKNPDGSWRTQNEWESARRKRQVQSRLDNLYRRKSLGKGFSQKNIDMLESTYGITPSTAQNVLTGRDLNLRGKELTNKLSTKSPVDNYNYNNMAMMEIANNPALSRYKQRQGLASFEDPWAGATVQQVGMNQEQLDRINKQHQTNLAADEGTTNFFEWLPGKKYVENFVGDIKGRDKTKLFSDTPKDIVYGDPTTGATTQEIQDYINSLRNVHGPIKNQNPSGSARKNLIGVAQGGRIGYKTGGLASLWPR